MQRENLSKIIGEEKVNKLSEKALSLGGEKVAKRYGLILDYMNNLIYDCRITYKKVNGEIVFEAEYGGEFAVTILKEYMIIASVV